jgi:serine phosphatase RsbU (regulator of sigma subunit)
VIVPWQAGDLLFLFTDGLSDAFAGGGSGGEGRLLAEVGDRLHEPPNDILEHLFELTVGARPGIPADDRTAVLIRV